MNFTLNNNRTNSNGRSVLEKMILASFVSVISLTGFENAFSQADTVPRTGNIEYSTGLESFEISDAEMPVLKEQAIRGSGNLAYRISQYYRFLKIDADESNRWLTIAAENGDPTAEFGLGNLLSSSSDKQDKQDKLRACFWLDKARKAGSEKLKFLASDKLLSLKVLCSESAD